MECEERCRSSVGIKVMRRGGGRARADRLSRGTCGFNLSRKAEEARSMPKLSV